MRKVKKSKPATHTLKVRRVKTRQGDLVVADLAVNGRVVVKNALAARFPDGNYILYIADALRDTLDAATDVAVAYFHSHLHAVYGQQALLLHRSQYSIEGAIATAMFTIPKTRGVPTNVVSVPMYIFD